LLLNMSKQRSLVVAKGDDKRRDHKDDSDAA
jgi:hypothetical protein